MSWALEKQREPLHRDVRSLMLTRNTNAVNIAGVLLTNLGEIDWTALQ